MPGNCRRRICGRVELLFIYRDIGSAREHRSSLTTLTTQGRRRGRETWPPHCSPRPLWPPSRAPPLFRPPWWLRSPASSPPRPSPSPARAMTSPLSPAMVEEFNACRCGHRPGRRSSRRCPTFLLCLPRSWRRKSITCSAWAGFLAWNSSWRRASFTASTTTPRGTTTGGTGPCGSCPCSGAPTRPRC